MARYLEFVAVSVEESLRNQFLKEAKGMNLGKIISRNKNFLRLSFHQAKYLEEGEEPTYLIMIGGFPVIWIPGKIMRYFGFYPKFSNDEYQTADDLSEFANVTEINFFKKWSGFLAQVIVFKNGQQIYWTVTSKNSASGGSPFVVDAKRILQAKLNDNVLKLMAEWNLYLCAEIMSTSDQTHGARVLTETPVITAVGIGKIYTLKDFVPDTDQTQFVNFYDHQTLVEFCQANGLPCDSAVQIVGPEACRTFMTELANHRDFMNDDKLEQLLFKLKESIKIIRGTVAHKDILGNCLEGLVLRLTIQNKIITKKYKFPFYTIRTMLLRPLFQKFTFGHHLMDEARKFVENCCISDKGKKFWYHFALDCFTKYITFSSTNSLVGDHILVAEEVWEEVDDGKSEERFRDFLKKIQR